MPNEPTVFAIASKNAAKISALRSVAAAAFGSYRIIAIAAESGVSETPTSDTEAIQGCANRLTKMQSSCKDAIDYWVALEGLIERTTHGDFVYGWAAVRKTGRSQPTYGCSGKVMLPTRLLDAMPEGARLSTYVENTLDKDGGSRINVLGTNGLLTRGLYDRTMEFETAIRCALGASLHADNTEYAPP
jgi:inosine/xanthosine triphosphatase